MKRKNGSMSSRLEEEDVEGLGEELEVEGLQRLHQPTTKIIQPIEPMKVGEKQTKKLKLSGESGNSLPLPKPAPMETAGEGEEVETGEKTTLIKVQAVQ